MYKRPKINGSKTQLGNQISPYAQRAWVSAEFSGLKYSYQEINPYESKKNQNWRSVSLKG